MKKYRFAVVGALGNVGTIMCKLLEESTLPIEDLMLMDISANEGQVISWRGRQKKITSAQAIAFDEVDIALFSAGASAALQLVPEAIKHGCICIDNSTAFRMNPEHPLVIPEVNPEALNDHKGIVANPNCSTIQMLVLLKPLHDIYRIKRVVVSTYQAVSGSGQSAVQELKDQVRAFTSGRVISSSIYPYQIAFNVLPHIDTFEENGYTREEMKMINETHKILDPNILVTATTVRVPVINGHSESINIETEKSFKISEVIHLWENSSGIVLADDPGNNIYPLPIKASGKDAVYVGRIRRDNSTENGINLWCVSDNLRKGAALNTIQIAEELINRDLVRISHA